MTAEVGRRLIDGALAFASGDYARAVEAICRSEDSVRIGGSHAQRDIVNLTLIAAAERSGSGAWRGRFWPSASRSAQSADRGVSTPKRCATFSRSLGL